MKTYTAFYSQYGLRGYEKELFKRELQTLVADATVLAQNGQGVTFKTADLQVEEKLQKLTFCNGFKSNDERYTTLQHKIEVSGTTSARSRNLRYLGHGIHEYKGRFYPQLARCLMQVVGASEDKIGLDPFCGSGTLLYEAALNGYVALGFDINPVAQLIANAKLQSIFFDNKDLEELKQKVDSFQVDKELNMFDLCNRHREYLLRWFPRENLDQLLHLKAFIDLRFRNRAAQFLRVVLSDILRQFSWQRPDEQRTRRRKDEPPTDVITHFKKRIHLEVGKLEQTNILNEKDQSVKPNLAAFLGDARYLPLPRNSIDYVVTSPPYATALPYIDADRLSMFFFDLVSKTEFSSLGKQSIGNREISLSERRRLEHECFTSVNLDSMPNEIIDLVEKIQKENEPDNVGFRRQNLPALLYKYFSDMFRVCYEIRRVLKEGARSALVIGDNFTIAGGKRLEIPTSELIALLATKACLKLVERIPLAPPRSYTIYARNAVRSECVLLFEAI